MALTRPQGAVWNRTDNLTASTAVDQDGTPSVLDIDVLSTANTLATTITAFDSGTAGQHLLVIFGDALTTVDFSGSTIKGNGLTDRLFANGESMSCAYDGTNWYCEIQDTIDTSATGTSLDATPDVAGLTVLTTANAGSTTITTLDGGTPGQTVLVVIGDANTTIDFSGSSMKSNYSIDRLMRNGESLSCTYDGTNWHCVFINSVASIQALSGAGAVDVVSEITEITTTGADALTLANGVDHQRKFLVMASDGGAGTLTPTNLGNGATLTFDDVGDCADLIFTNGSWFFLGGTATLS